ncbi:MAG: hypothetical protein LBN27_00775 [Prevotellaceae bacterium]|nr:hypothetical protein [Prevotellaceae bacterium]
MGIIDNDKDKQEVFNTFNCLQQFELFSIYQIGNKSHFIITIGAKHKAIEDFILKNAEKCNISLSDYNLPTDLNGLKNITKQIRSVKDAELKFKRLFTAIKQNENSDFSILAKWIEAFKTDPYHLEI